MNDSEILEQRIHDITAIAFGDSVTEITSSLAIVLTLYEVDDEPNIIGACKSKLLEGVQRLQEISVEAKNAADDFKPE